MPTNAARPIELLHKIARGQHGVFTLTQARAAGLSSRQVQRRAANDEWSRVFEGIYRMAGTPRARLQDLQVAALWGGERYAFSHFTAAELWGLDGIPRRKWIDLIGGRTTRHAPDGPIQLRPHRSRDFNPSRRDRHNGFYLTPLLQILIDLAPLVKASALELAILDAMRRRLVDRDELRESLKELRGMGLPKIEALRRVAGAGHLQELDSPLESRFLQAAIEEGVPPPSAGFDVVHKGRTLGRYDFAFPAARLVVECDSRQHHERVAAFQSDRRRDRKLSAIGWRCFRVTNESLTVERRETFDDLRATLTCPLGAFSGREEPRAGLAYLDSAGSFLEPAVNSPAIPGEPEGVLDTAGSFVQRAAEWRGGRWEV